MTRASPALLLLVQSMKPEVRIAAIECLGELGVWDTDSMRHLLQTEKHVGCVRAALGVCALLEMPPIEAILALLGHPDLGVVRAAQSAMPGELKAKQIQSISEFISRSDPGPAIAGLEVLAGLDSSPARDQALVEHLNSELWSLKRSCLSALCENASKLEDVEPVWRIIEDPKSNVELQVVAFLVLERTGSVHPEKTLAHLEKKCHPVARLAAARCLISVGERTGLKTLIDLLHTVRGPDVDDEDRICAIGGSHEILVDVSKQDHGFSRKAWLRWYGERGPVEPGKLDAPPRLTW